MSPYNYIRNCWYVAGLSHEFEIDTLAGHRIAGRPIVIWRNRGGKVVAFDDRCAHKRFPLSKGRIMEDGTLECAYHGLRYNDAGKCVAIPSQPEGPIPKQAKTNSFPVIEQDGIVWVWPGDPEHCKKRKPPRTMEVGDDDWESIDSGPMEVPANYLLLIENLLDITHFYPLHDGNIGDLENSLIPVEFVEEVIEGNRTVKSVREVKNYDQPSMLVDWLGYKTVDRHHTHAMMSPGLTRVEMRVAPPGKLGTDKDRGYILYHTHTPVDRTNLVWHWIVNTRVGHHCAGNPAKPVASRFAETFPEVAEQDLWALEEQQKMFNYPDDGYNEVLLKTDKAVARVRKILSDLEADQTGSTDTATP